MTAGGSSILMSPLIPPPSGPTSSSERPSRLTRFHVTCFAIATPFSASISPDTSKLWASRKYFRRPGHPGSEPTVERVIGTIRRECLDHVIAASSCPSPCLDCKIKAFSVLDVFRVYRHGLVTSHSMPAPPAEYRRPRPRLNDGSLSLAFSLKLRGHEIRVKLLRHRMDRTYTPTRRYARPPDSAATEFTIGAIGSSRSSAST